MSAFRFTLPTTYGPATFTVDLNPHGDIILPQAPLASLPDAAFKLSYGADWVNVRRHFAELTRLLTYSLRVFRYLDTQPTGLAPAIAQLPPTTEAPPADPFWLENPDLSAIYDPDEAVRRRALAQFAGRRNTARAQSAAGIVFDYLVFLTAAETLRVVPEAYQALGSLASQGAREFLLHELAQDGRHPYTRHLLAALKGYTSQEVLEQARRQYQAGHIGEDDLPALLDLISTLPGEQARDFATEILGDHAYLVDRIAQTLRRIGLSAGEIAQCITTQFWSEQEYAYLDDLLLTANAARWGTLDLRAMNERAAHEIFVDVPPVNWPQQLEAGWSELLRRTSLPVALAVVGEYLDRPEPRLQRNALLQLKVLTAREDFDGLVPPGIESRLAELLAARYDKVYVEVLNLLARKEMRVHDPLPMVQGILRKSLQTGYRTVILKALRRTGDFPAARLATREFYSRTINESAGSGELEHVDALLPYLEKYLADVSDLREAMRVRQHQS